MRTFVRTSSFLIGISFLASCAEQIPQEPDGNYSQLTIGNYWVYDKYSIDTLGNETALNSLDSVYIEGDTLIDGFTYYKMVEPLINITSPYVLSVPQKISFVRDSADCIVTSTHRTIFSSTYFNSTLWTNYHVGVDTHYKETASMVDQDLSISVPAGNFTTSTFQRLIESYPAWSAIIGDSYIFRTRYAEDIGIVTQHLPLPYGQRTRIERRLIRYYVQ